MPQTVCASCGTPQGPFSRVTGKPLCKEKVLKECAARRMKLEIEWWGKRDK